MLPWSELHAFGMISQKKIRPLEESYENLWSSKWEEMNGWTKLVMGRQKEKEMRRILKEANGLEKRLCEIQIQPAGVAWWSVKHCAVSEKKMAFMDQSHLKRCQREDEVEFESPVAKSGQDESQVGRCEGEAYYELCKQRGFWGLPHARLRRGGRAPSAPVYRASTPF